MTNREIAESIIVKLCNASSPEQCTWGQNNPDAHAELFNGYFEDMTETVIKILNKNYGKN